MTVVLFVLRTEHARIVGCHDQQTAFHAGIDRIEERVGSHVHPHLLHSDHGSPARVSCPDGHVHGHLLVDRPLGVDLLVLGHVFQDLRTGRSWIARGNLHTVFVGSTGYGFVT